MNDLVLGVPVLAVRSGSFVMPLGNMAKLGSHKLEHEHGPPARRFFVHIMQAKAAGVSQNTLNARIKALAAVPSAPTLCTQTVAVAMTAASNAFDALHAGEEPAAPACVSAA